MPHPDPAVLPRRRRSTAATAVLATAALLGSSACLADQAGAGPLPRGAGLPAGASKAEYIEAFADIPPIHLTTQIPSSPGDLNTLHLESYVDALYEWSGGTIIMDVAYGNAIAEPDQVPQALEDGRLDFDMVYPIYDPSRFPANGGALANASHLGAHDPVAGSLSSAAGYLDVLYDTPEIMAETEAEGFKLLLPWAPQSSIGLMCAEPLDSLADLEGAQVRVGGSAFVTQAEALGMTPLSMPYSEIYQGLQRGTLDCVLQGRWAAASIGTIPLAPNYTIDPDAGFARMHYGLGFGQERWDGLPLVAQQLIHDRLDIYIGEMFEQAVWGGMALATEQDGGAVITDLDDDAVAALEQANERLLAESSEAAAAGDSPVDGSALAAELEESTAAWHAVAVGELDYPEISDAEFAEWYADHSAVDADPFIDRIRTDILDPHRPE